MKRMFLLLLFTLLIGTIVMGVGFNNNPVINNNDLTYTDQNLTCEYNISVDTTWVNVTWFKGGVFNKSTNVSLNTSDTLSYALTTKGDVWVCNVTLYNGTNTDYWFDSVTILNSKPTTEIPPAGIFYPNGTDIGSIVQLYEDEPILIDVNATDADPADNISLRYGPSSEYFCTRLSESLGTYNCSPTHSDVLNGTGPGEIATQYNISLYADDLQELSGRPIIFNVVPVNDLPNVSISNQTTAVNETFNETFTITDEEEYFPATASIDSATTSNDIEGKMAVIVEGGSTLHIYQSASFQFSDVGNHTIGINITDAQNASDIILFTLEITSVNRPPYFVNVTPSNYSSALYRRYVLDQGESIIINVTANDPDANLTNETIFFDDNTDLFNVQTTYSIVTNVTNATGYINYTALNADVGNYIITLIAEDAGGFTNTTTLNFTINNVNDPPVINNQSYDPGNTGGNINITHLIAYLDAPFYYQINFSDPDLLIGLDTLTWSDNSSIVNVTAAGVINFTPTGSPFNETINITVNDTYNNRSSVSILFEVRPNTPPYFNQSFPEKECSEGLPCFFNVSYYAKDDDGPGDNVSEYTAVIVGANLTDFSINATTGVINFTPLQDEIGNYTINLTISDTRAATSWQLLNISINNTEDAPVWYTYDFSSETIVETHTFNFLLYADDQDLLLPASTENLTFTSNLSWVSINKELTSGNRTRALLSFTPNSMQDGSHTIRLNVTDITNQSTFVNVTFTIYNDTEAPLINAFRPFGDDVASNILVDDWHTNGAGYVVENITLPENTTNLLFQVNASDDDAAWNQLNYTWYYDGAIVQGPNNANATTRSFGFFSEGSHTVRVRVNDTRLESTLFTWNINVTNVNRAPRFLTNYTENVTIDATTTLPNFFLLYSGQKFFDPDDDLNSSGDIGGNETFNLTINNSGCSHATLQQVDTNLRVTPLSLGTCFVTFTAQDSEGATATSNLVTIIVSEVPQGSLSSSVSSGGGGGGITTKNTLIPFQQEVETPFPLSIVAPGKVTIYENQTVEVPVLISNNWTDTMYGVRLYADSNVSGLNFSFDTDYIEELAVGSTSMAMLTVEGYRLGENFEVTIFANVTTPEIHDSVLVTFNAIESSNADRKAVEVKVTFAQDLLSQNEECQELNEYLLEAEEYLHQGDVQASRNLLDFVINGCKYMISKTSPEMQEPGVVRNPFVELDEGTLKAIAYIALGIFILISLLGLLYHHHATRDMYDF